MIMSHTSVTYATQVIYSFTPGQADSPMTMCPLLESLGIPLAVQWLESALPGGPKSNPCGWGTKIMQAAMWPNVK